MAVIQSEGQRADEYTAEVATHFSSEFLVQEAAALDLTGPGVLGLPISGDKSVLRPSPSVSVWDVLRRRDEMREVLSDMFVRWGDE